MKWNDYLRVVEARFPLTHALETWWFYDSGRYMRFVRNMEITRDAKGIPSFLG